MPLGPVAAAGAAHNVRPLAVMPPALSSAPHTSSWEPLAEPELRVFSLPGLAVIHTHRLEGMQVGGLAADPWGTALAVCDGVIEDHARPGLAAAGHAAAGVAGTPLIRTRAPSIRRASGSHCMA